MDGIDQLLAMTDHMEDTSLASVIRWGEGKEYSSEAGLGMSAELGQISLRDHLLSICVQLSLDMPTEDERRILEAWPHYKGSRDPVMLGGEVDGLAGRVSIIEFFDGACNVYSSTEQVDDHLHLAPGERVGRRPVLAADGEPLEPGQTVFGTGRSQHEFRVLRLDGPRPKTNGRFSVLCFDADDDEECWCDPGLLTHAKPELPDSWERIEEDARRSDYKYWRCCGHACEDCPARVDGMTPRERYGTDSSCAAAIKLDIVRRCKALSERSE